MHAIANGEISRFSDHLGFNIQGLSPGGPISLVISRKDTRLVFPDWTGFSDKLPDQDFLYRFLSAEGGQWRFSITEEMLPSVDVLTTNCEWLLKMTLREAGHWDAGWGAVDALTLQQYKMVKFDIPGFLKGKQLVILPGGAKCIR
jgi:hypothetical protein